MKTIAFFGIKGGTGKTTIAYHLAWMLAERGLRVLMVDLDPQANLTTLSLGDERTYSLWRQAPPRTISSVLEKPTREGLPADVRAIAGQQLSERIMILPGDLGLSQYEDILSAAWHQCVFGEKELLSSDLTKASEVAFHRFCALNTVIGAHSRHFRADMVLLDLAPNLGAINRAALLAADGILFPLLPDRLSVSGLHGMGHIRGEWARKWAGVRNRLSSPVLLPSGLMEPIGYVLSRISMLGNRPTASSAQSADAIAVAYAQSITGEAPPPPGAEDPNCLASIKNYHSLAALAYEAHKPMFLLRPADGAMGGHMSAAQDAYRAFNALAERVADKVGIRLPPQ